MKIPTALYLQEQHDVECGGRHIQYFIATFLTKPYPIEPTLGDLHDYRKCKGWRLRIDKGRIQESNFLGNNREERNG